METDVPKKVLQEMNLRGHGSHIMEDVKDTAKMVTTSSLYLNIGILSYLNLEMATLAAMMSREGVQDAGGDGGSSGGGGGGHTAMTVVFTSAVGTGMRNMVRFCMCPERRNTTFLRGWKWTAR